MESGHTQHREGKGSRLPPSSLIGDLLSSAKPGGQLQRFLVIRTHPMPGAVKCFSFSHPLQVPGPSGRTGLADPETSPEIPSGDEPSFENL